jgi:predicted nucleic-acid-binding Zn-ribbon protein
MANESRLVMAEISLDKVKRVSHRMIITHTDIISVKCPHCGYSE